MKRASKLASSDKLVLERLKELAIAEALGLHEGLPPHTGWYTVGKLYLKQRWLESYCTTRGWYNEYSIIERLLPKCVVGKQTRVHVGINAFRMRWAVRGLFICKPIRLLSQCEVCRITVLGFVPHAEFQLRRLADLRMGITSKLGGRPILPGTPRSNALMPDGSYIFDMTPYAKNAKAS